jgi:hypothetical protein
MSYNLNSEIEDIKNEFREQKEKALNHDEDDVLMSILRAKINILQSLRAINEAYDNITKDRREEKELNKKKNLLKKFKIHDISKKMSTELIKTAIENNKIKFELTYGDDNDYEGAEFTLNSISFKILEQCGRKCGAIFDKESGCPTELYNINDDDYKCYIDTLNDKNDNFGYHLILTLYNVINLS